MEGPISKLTQDAVSHELWTERLRSSLLPAGRLPELLCLMGLSTEQLTTGQLVSLPVRSEPERAPLTWKAQLFWNRMWTPTGALPPAGGPSARLPWSALSPCAHPRLTGQCALSSRGRLSTTRQSIPGSRVWIQEEDKASSEKGRPFGPRTPHCAERAHGWRTTKVSLGTWLWSKSSTTGDSHLPEDCLQCSLPLPPSTPPASLLPLPFAQVTE